MDDEELSKLNVSFCIESDDNKSDDEEIKRLVVSFDGKIEFTELENVPSSPPSTKKGIFNHVFAFSFVS